MSKSNSTDCKLIHPDSGYSGKQGLSYLTGIAKQTVGSSNLCMVILNIPPSGRSKAHKHENHETAIYMMSGVANAWYGDRLQNIVRPGDMFYIPAGMPHLAANLGTEPVVQVIARTDPNEQESVVLLPDLECFVPT